MGRAWFLKWILWLWIHALKIVGDSLDLFGQPVMAYLFIPRSMPAHLQYLSILLSCVWIYVMLLKMTTKSSAYAAKLMVIGDVLNLYPNWF
jgi:hypothetical protein